MKLTRMASVEQRPIRASLPAPMRVGVVFVLFYLYVWLRIEPHLVYYGRGLEESFPIFKWGLGFFRGFLGYPGGLVEYLSALLSQYYCHAGVGALIVTLLGLLAYVATGGLLGSFGRRNLSVVALIPVILLLVMSNSYGNPLPTGLGMLIAVFVASFYARVGPRTFPARLGIFLLLSVPVYYVTGGNFFLFAALCGSFELIARRQVLGMGYFALAAALPYLAGHYVFGIRTGDAYWRLLPFHKGTDPRGAGVALSLYFFFPVAVFLVGLRQELAAFVRRLWRVLMLFKMALSSQPTSNDQQSSAKARHEGARRFVERFRKSRLAGFYELITVIVVTALVLHFSHSSALKTRLEIEYCACQEQWGRLLEKAKQVPASHYDIYVRWDVTRALYHTGRLSKMMFHYPQHPLNLIPSPATFKAMTAMANVKLTDILMELGDVNEAERSACEALAFLGDRPAILKRLFFIHIVKGQTDAARIYLGALCEDIVYGTWAKGYLSRMKSDPDLSGDEEVQRLRALKPRRDYVTDFTTEKLLLELLKSNKHNRMAFEYLMAYYLLNRQLDKVALNLRRLNDFACLKMPRHYQEAIILYQHRTGKNVPLKGGFISSHTVNRFTSFRELASRYALGDRSAWKRLAQEFGSTYWFYFLYGVSGPGK